MADLTVYETLDGGDVEIIGNNVPLTDSIFNQIYMGLFGGNIAESTQDVGENQEQRFDYFANELLFADSTDSQFNSSFEKLLSTVSLNSAGIRELETAAAKDLSFMSNLADIAVTVSLVDNDRISVDILAKEPDSIDSREFTIIWDATRNEVIQGDPTSDPIIPPEPPTREFKITHNNTGTMSLLWSATGGASFDVNWGDGNTEPFSNNISHDYSGSGAAPFEITLEGAQSDINLLTKLQIPFNDSTVTEIDLFNLYGLSDLDIFLVNNLVSLHGVGDGHTATIDLLVAHCPLLAGVLDFSNLFGISGMYNFSQNPLVTNILSPSKTISSSIINFKYEGLSNEGFTPDIDIDISNFTNLSNTVHIDVHTSVNSLVLPSTWGGNVGAFDLHDLGGISGALDLRNIDSVSNLHLYSNPNVTSFDLRTITFTGTSDLWVHGCSALASLQIDNVEVNDVKLSRTGFTDFVIPLGTNIVFITDCEMAFINLDQTAIDSIVDNVWDNRAKWTVSAYTPDWDLVGTTVSSGTFDGTTDWIGGIPQTPQAKLFDLDANHGFNIQNNT